MYRKGKLLISLNHQKPFLSLIENVTPTPTIAGSLNDNLRKLVKDGNVTNIKAINNDRIVSIEFTKVNDYYEKVKRELIIELIPHRQNLIVLDENGLIIFATHYTGLESPRPLIKGLKYSPVENKTSTLKEDFDLVSFQQEAEKYFLESKYERTSERFKPLLTHIKSRIKSLNGKLLVLNNGISAANKNLSLQEVGQMILSYSYDMNELRNYVLENKIEYDFQLSPGVNAEKYFKKYKKAKRTIEMDNLELDKTKKEIEYLSLTYKQIPYLKEEDLIELAAQICPKKFTQKSKNKIVSTYGTIKCGNTKIIFGKNAKQNDEVTFKRAKKEHYFLHIKDTHGAHVIIESSSPNNEEILLACEIALLMSGREDGEVQYTQVKNIKKGDFLGSALLSSYESFYINKVRDSTKLLLTSY
jgi:predicted ribosome quality control (RQC) complex YloA/Tae2 family protein